MIGRLEIVIDDVNLDYEGKEWPQELGSVFGALQLDHPGALVRVFKKEHKGETCPVCEMPMDANIEETLVREDYIS